MEPQRETSGPAATHPKARDDDPEPLQITALGTQTNLVTITIGGDDLHFASILQDCILNLSCSHASELFSVVKNLATNITKLQATLTKTYEAIKKAAPHAAIYVMGYPDILPPHPSVAARLNHMWSRLRTSLRDLLDGWLPNRRS